MKTTVMILNTTINTPISTSIKQKNKNFLYFLLNFLKNHLIWIIFGSIAILCLFVFMVFLRLLYFDHLEKRALAQEITNETEFSRTPSPNNYESDSNIIQSNFLGNTTSKTIPLRKAPKQILSSINSQQSKTENSDNNHKKSQSITKTVYTEDDDVFKHSLGHTISPTQGTSDGHPTGAVNEIITTQITYTLSPTKKDSNPECKADLLLMSGGSTPSRKNKNDSVISPTTYKLLSDIELEVIETRETDLTDDIKYDNDDGFKIVTAPDHSIGL